MELLPVLWTHFRYLFLWEGSPEPDYMIPSASGDASYNLVEWSTFSGKLPFFSRIWARDRKIFTGVFPNLGSSPLCELCDFLANFAVKMPFDTAPKCLQQNLA